MHGISFEVGFAISIANFGTGLQLTKSMYPNKNSNQLVVLTQFKLILDFVTFTAVTAVGGPTLRERLSLSGWAVPQTPVSVIPYPLW